jgi:5,10-methylenetetrahydromethanopterin reductase
MGNRKIDEIDFFTHAENLGYAAVWVADSQLLFSDCYAVLALAAARTKRLRLGPGTAICGTRLPPVQVAAVATLNRLAPGRIHLGIGTGNTAMRAMGQKPMRIKDYAEYLRVKYMNLEPKIPLYVSGFGPRAMRSPVCTGMAWCLPSRHAAWPCRRPWPTSARV